GSWSISLLAGSLPQQPNVQTGVRLLPLRSQTAEAAGVANAKAAAVRHDEVAEITETAQLSGAQRRYRERPLRHPIDARGRSRVNGGAEGLHARRQCRRRHGSGGIVAAAR